MAMTARKIMLCKKNLQKKKTKEKNYYILKKHEPKFHLYARSMLSVGKRKKGE